MRFIGKEVLALPGHINYRAAILSGQKLDTLLRRLPCAAHPQVFWVKLSNIKYNGLMEISRQGGQFLSGDRWEFPERHIRHSIFESVSEGTYRWSIHETLRNIFLEEKSFRKTPQYEGIISALESTQFSVPVWGCKTRQDVDDLFGRMRLAFNDMRDNGYKTQVELGKLGGDEIQLYVTENGELLKGIGGNHRILMAEILEIDWIPIVIHGASVKFVLNLLKSRSTPPHLAVRLWFRDSELFQKSRPDP
jgi:hypothetical protein